MVLSIEKSIKEVRCDLDMGFSNLETIPRLIFSENVLDVIIDDNNHYTTMFIVKYNFEENWAFINIFGDCNEFCKLMHTGGHLLSN